MEREGKHTVCSKFASSTLSTEISEGSRRPKGPTNSSTQIFVYLSDSSWAQRDRQLQPREGVVEAALRTIEDGTGFAASIHFW